MKRYYTEEPDLGLILEETKDYAIVIGVGYADHADKSVECYCIRNRTTHIDELCTVSLAKARMMLPELQHVAEVGLEARMKELSGGLDSEGGMELNS